MRILDGAVKVSGRFVSFEYCTLVARSGPVSKRDHLGFGHRLEILPHLDRLLDSRERIAAGDHDRRWQAHRVAEALLRGRHAFANRCPGRQGLHAEYADSALHENRQYGLLEAVVMDVETVQRHLDGIPGEWLVDHLQMDGWIFVSSETDEADFSRLPSRDERLERATSRNGALGIGGANDFVNLNQIDNVGLETYEALIDLFRRGVGVVAIDFRHEKDALAITVAEGVPHLDLGLAERVVPAIIHERDAGVDRGSDDPERLGRTGCAHDVRSAESDCTYLLTGLAQHSIFHCCRSSSIRSAGAA